MAGEKQPDRLILDLGSGREIENHPVIETMTPLLRKEGSLKRLPRRHVIRGKDVSTPTHRLILGKPDNLRFHPNFG